MTRSPVGGDSRAPARPRSPGPDLLVRAKPRLADPAAPPLDELAQIAELADRARAALLDTLAFAPGREATSRAFHCPGRAHVFFEWRCEAPAPGCEVVLPLEGVTSLSESLRLPSGCRASTGDAAARLTCVFR